MHCGNKNRQTEEERDLGRHITNIAKDRTVTTKKEQRRTENIHCERRNIKEEEERMK